MSGARRELAAFLIEAKRHTYAGLDDDATMADPLLPGSKQLEHHAAPFAYRDIYFGMGFFVGQETVARHDKIIWSMSYGGGASPDISDRTELVSIYAFLRKALLVSDIEMPYRGPATFDIGEMSYLNQVEGELSRFHGVERISKRGSVLYELHYSGGLVR
jgi:hypothetical protein